jgi:hypothetical protein
MSHSNVITFAAALDNDDFATAIQFVTADCVYDAPSGQIIGAEAIMDSYAKNAAWARKAFDFLEFRSQVEMRSPTEAVVEYTDITEHNGVHHTYRCRQIATIDDKGMICAIKHYEIPEQQEKLNAFLERVGVKRP